MRKVAFVCLSVPPDYWIQGCREGMKVKGRGEGRTVPIGTVVDFSVVSPLWRFLAGKSDS